MLSLSHFKEMFRQHFGHTPTGSQEEAIDALSEFIYEKGERFLFILQGYAGTGKTTLVSALVKALEQVRVRTVMRPRSASLSPRTIM